MDSIYDFEANAIDGRLVSLSEYRGQVLLIVNVASRCALTSQYATLEELYIKHRSEGFSILGFPCNQFGNQEPGDEKAIQEFCSLKYDVSFPMFAKVDVNGEGAHPLFQFLEAKAPGWFGIQRIHWNFTKFLVDRQGQPIKRFGPGFPPTLLDRSIREALHSVASV